MNWKEFLTGYKGKNMPSELNEFNWGAFLLTFIWGFKHKAWITLLGLPLIWFQLPLGLNWILYTILQFYCGFKGNMWAYQVDWWMTPKDFRKTQAIWAICAITLNILIPIILFGTAIRFVQKNPDNPSEFIKNAQCSIAYSKLNKGFKHVLITSTVTDSEIAESFAQEFKNAKTDGPHVNFSIKSDGNDVPVYSISFTQLEPQTQCNILRKNCMITSSFILPEEINFSNHCSFYFNNEKEFEPDEDTKKVLKKGYNIFKYL